MCFRVIRVHLCLLRKVHDLYFRNDPRRSKLIVNFVARRRQNSVSSGIYDSRVSEGHYDVIKPKVSKF